MWVYNLTLIQAVERFDNDLIALILNKGILFTPGIEQNIELFISNKKTEFWIRHCCIFFLT